MRTELPARTDEYRYFVPPKVSITEYKKEPEGFWISLYKWLMGLDCECVYTNNAQHARYSDIKFTWCDKCETWQYVPRKSDRTELLKHMFGVN